MKLCHKMLKGNRLSVTLTDAAGNHLTTVNTKPADIAAVTPDEVWLVELGGAAGYYATGRLTAVKVGLRPHTGKLCVRTLEHQTRWDIDKVRRWLIKLEAA